MKPYRERMAEFEEELKAYFGDQLRYGDIKADDFNLSTKVGVFPFGVPAGLDVKIEKKKNP